MKRAGDAGQPVTYDDALHSPPMLAEDVIALTDALDQLAAVDPRRAQVVEHRVFAGLTTPETARLLGVSAATVERDWRAARAWLAAEIAGGAAESPQSRRT